MNNMMRIKRWWQTEPAITQVLLGITVAVFLVEWLMGDGAMLVFNSLGAKNNQAIAAGQWWRLVTPLLENTLAKLSKPTQSNSTRWLRS